MGALKSILIGVMTISIVTFVALFGRLPAFRKGPIGFLHRLLWNKFPAALYKFDVFLTGGRISSSLWRLGHYLIYENHPLILIFFLVILLGSQLLFVPSSFFRLPTIHRFLSITLCVVPHLFTYKAVTSTSSYVTPQNHWQMMQQYPYDHVLFHPGHICQTCHLLKPARSKHCSICNACVARHDHHCVWVMNCLGKGNYVFFIGMLLSIAVLLSYGAYLAHVLLRDALQNSIALHSPGISVQKSWSVGRTWSQYFEAWAWALSQDIRVGGVGMLAALTAPLAWGLFLYHVYLIWAGMTTNESSKWADWKDDIADGLVFRSERHAEDHDGHLIPEIEPFVDWPITSPQRLVRCENGKIPGVQIDSRENGEMSPTRGHLSHKSRWKRLQGLHEVDNLYDLGFWDNLADAMPGSILSKY